MKLLPALWNSQRRSLVDEFDKHRTLGELILIDRITNMTSACGVVRKTLVSQDKSQIGKVDEQVRAGLKGQTPVVVEFPIGKEESPLILQNR